MLAITSNCAWNLIIRLLFCSLWTSYEFLQQGFAKATITGICNWIPATGQNTTEFQEALGPTLFGFLSLSLSLKHCWAFRLQRELSSPGRRWLGPLNPPPFTGRVNPSGGGLPGTLSKRPPGCGWGRLGSLHVRASVPLTFPLVVSESWKEAWGWSLAPSASERRCARPSPTLHQGRSEAGAPGLQPPFLIMVGHWQDTWLWTQLTSLGLFHILKN